MSSSVFGKAWAVMILLLVVVQGIFLGEDLGSKDGKGAVVDAILLAFWVFALVWFHFSALREEKMDLEFERSKNKLDEAMGDMFGAIKKDIDHRTKIEKALDESIKVIGADRAPKPSEFKKVEDKFHELTGDHYLKLTAVKGDIRPSAEVSNEPFETKPARRKPAVKKAPVAKKGEKNAK